MKKTKGATHRFARGRPTAARPSTSGSSTRQSSLSPAFSSSSSSRASTSTAHALTPAFTPPAPVARNAPRAPQTGVASSVSPVAAPAATPALTTRTSASASEAPLLQRFVPPQHDDALLKLGQHTRAVVEYFKHRERGLGKREAAKAAGALVGLKHAAVEDIVRQYETEGGILCRYAGTGKSGKIKDRADVRATFQEVNDLYDRGAPLHIITREVQRRHGVSSLGTIAEMANTDTITERRRGTPQYSAEHKAARVAYGVKFWDLYADLEPGKKLLHYDETVNTSGDRGLMRRFPNQAKLALNRTYTLRTAPKVMIGLVCGAPDGHCDGLVTFAEVCEAKVLTRGDSRTGSHAGDVSLEHMNLDGEEFIRFFVVRILPGIIRTYFLYKGTIVLVMDNATPHDKQALFTVYGHRLINEFLRKKGLFEFDLLFQISRCPDVFQMCDQSVFCVITRGTNHMRLMMKHKERVFFAMKKMVEERAARAKTAARVGSSGDMSEDEVEEAGNDGNDDASDVEYTPDDLTCAECRKDLYPDDDYVFCDFCLTGRHSACCGEGFVDSDEHRALQQQQRRAVYGSVAGAMDLNDERVRWVCSGVCEVGLEAMQRVADEQGDNVVHERWAAKETSKAVLMATRMFLETIKHDRDLFDRCHKSMMNNIRQMVAVRGGTEYTKHYHHGAHEQPLDLSVKPTPPAPAGTAAAPTDDGATADAALTTTTPPPKPRKRRGGKKKGATPEAKRVAAANEVDRAVIAPHRLFTTPSQVPEAERAPLHVPSPFPDAEYEYLAEMVIAEWKDNTHTDKNKASKAKKVAEPAKKGPKGGEMYCAADLDGVEDVLAAFDDNGVFTPPVSEEEIVAKEQKTRSGRITQPKKAK